MDLEKLKPWNWFKHEEGGSDSDRRIPVKRGERGMPAGSLMRLHDEMDRWFDDAFKSFGMPSRATRFEPGKLFESGMRGFFRPQIDICGDENCYEISLDVPGLKEEDLSLEIEGDVLSIKGSKEERSEDKDKHYYRVERSYGSFQRTLALPDDADAEKITASLDKGVLKLEIPRRQAAEKDVKRISISSS